MLLEMLRMTSRYHMQYVQANSKHQLCNALNDIWTEANNKRGCIMFENSFGLSPKYPFTISF